MEIGRTGAFKPLLFLIELLTLRVRVIIRESKRQKGAKYG